MNTDVTNAVQNTLKNSSGRPLLSVENTPQLAEIAAEKLNTDILKKSYEYADTAYNIQWGKDGIEDTQQKLKGLQGKVGEQVYAIAKLAYEHCRNIPNGMALAVTAQYFKALCEMDEKHLMSKYVEAKGDELPMTKLIPTWPVYKSTIAKGLEKGLDPMARDPATITEQTPKGSLLYPKASDYRAEVDKMEAKERGANERDTDSPADRKEAANALTVVSSGWSPKMKAAMSVMVEQLNRLDHANQDKFADDILVIGAKAKTLADTLHREVSGDTRTAAQTGTQPLTAEQLAAKLTADRSQTTEETPELTEELDPGTQAALQVAIDRDQQSAATERTETAQSAKSRKDKARRA